MTDNAKMELWDSVKDTDPKHTKEVNIRGGFTAINPQYQLERATALWGPYGHRWGVDRTQWSIVQVGDQTGLVLDATFFYPVGQERVEFPISVDMTLKVNDDCRKKLLTEARSKALSYLGFNADIFLGMWEDNRYVQDQQARYEANDKVVKRASIAAKMADDQLVLDKCQARAEEMLGNDTISRDSFDAIMEVVEARKKELAKKKPVGKDGGK